MNLESHPFPYYLGPETWGKNPKSVLENFARRTFALIVQHPSANAETIRINVPKASEQYSPESLNKAKNYACRYLGFGMSSVLQRPFFLDRLKNPNLRGFLASLSNHHSFNQAIYNPDAMEALFNAKQDYVDNGGDFDAVRPENAQSFFRHLLANHVTDHRDALHVAIEEDKGYVELLPHGHHLRQVLQTAPPADSNTLPQAPMQAMLQAPPQWQAQPQPAVNVQQKRSAPSDFQLPMPKHMSSVGIQALQPQPSPTSDLSDSQSPLPLLTPQLAFPAPTPSIPLSQPIDAGQGAWPQAAATLQQPTASPDGGWQALLAMAPDRDPFGDLSHDMVQQMANDWALANATPTEPAPNIVQPPVQGHPMDPQQVTFGRF